MSVILARWSKMEDDELERKIEEIHRKNKQNEKKEVKSM